MLKCPSCGADVPEDGCIRCRQKTRFYPCPKCGFRVRNPVYFKFNVS